MSHVVCLMNVEADRATFTWSEGPASFEPYTLDGMVYKDFKEIADEAREKLADLVKDYLFDEQNMPESAYALAEAGHELYRAMFDPGAEQARQARQVRKWLEKLAQQSEVDTLEIVVESPWSLPWNIIYDQEPDKDAFLAGDECSDHWLPFWGLRYNLAGGRKVDPLRRMPLLHDPKVLMVVDSEIRDGLPVEQQQRLAEFAEKHNFKIVHNKDDLQEAVKSERPELLYWLSHAEPDALVLAGESISPRNMRKLLRQDDDENFGGLAFLNACQTAEGGERGSFFEAFHNVGFAGMIGTEHQTVDQFANPLGLDFLEAFLDRGEPVGTALRKLRGRVPLGLLYGTYCPPDIRVDLGVGHESLDIHQVHVQGVALSAALPEHETETQTLPPLPDEPYRSLAYYDREDRALFAGRDPDIERFATYLDDASTRILVLHGESGVGKSSFLRAGVIPYLEEECIGYRFIRDREETESESAAGSVIFIRATNDLFGQLAQALCEFCARPYEYQSPLGDTATADLPGVLGEFVGNNVDQEVVRTALHSDPSLLGKIMAAISDRLPFSGILVIDQGEEVFTLAQSPEDQQRGRQALDMLRRTVRASSDFKVIFCLRTEYYGRVIDRLRRGLFDTSGIREYLLTDFDEDDLLDAIRRPTIDVEIPHTSEVPFEKYGFRYGDGVAEVIAQRVINYTTQRRDSVLPLMQVICAQLHRLAVGRAEKTITLDDLDALGGIEGGMRNHVEGLLNELLRERPNDKRPLQKLFTQLFIRQPDGSLTTALLPEEEVRKRWTGRMPFDELLSASLRLRLLKVNTLLIGMEGERRYVSLGHDALAKLAAQWDDELTRSERLRKTLKKVAAWAALAAVILLLVGAGAVMMHRKSEDNLAEIGVKSLMQAHPVAVPYAIELLEPREEYAEKYLLDGFHSKSGSHKEHAAYALAKFDSSTRNEAIEFLAGSITDRDRNGAESLNVVSALSEDRKHAVKLLREQFSDENVAAKVEKWRDQNLQDDAIDTEITAMKVRLATALLSLGETGEVKKMLRFQENPANRTSFIEHFQSWPGDLSVLPKLIRVSDDGDFLSGLCAALGRVPKKSLSENDLDELIAAISEKHLTAKDSGTHSASHWVLKQWDAVPPQSEPSTKPLNGFNWYTSKVGITMLLIPEKKNEIESFYLGDREVSQKDFNSFVREKYSESAIPLDWTSYFESRPDDSPMERLSWNDAVEFCNWLSETESLSVCYEKKDGQWVSVSNANGYRLPTESEWKYACRAGTVTDYSFGDDKKQLVMFGVYGFPHGQPSPSASKIPNRWGLWDMEGNVHEWCQCRPGKNDRVHLDGSHRDSPRDVGFRRRELQSSSTDRVFQVGFRVARNAG